MFSPFTAIVQLRNALYTLGVLGSVRLGAPVVSVGNITVGGTGKTPLVMEVSRILLDEGKRVCVLTRGYGRRNPTRRVLVSDGEKLLVGPEEGGDEPCEIAARLAGKVVIVADPDRVGAARFATERFQPDVFVLDDGFQHRRIRRDLDIVCVDATDPFGNGSVIPFGRLREPVANLRRADLIAVTRTNLVTDEELRALEAKIGELAPEAAMILCGGRIRDFTDVETGSATDVRQRKVFAFCGLGNPDNFFRQLAAEGPDLVGSHAFRDHRSYSQEDVDNICSMAVSHGAEAVVTTSKDTVKVRGFEFSLPFIEACLELEFDDKEKLRRAVLDAVR